MEKTNTQENSGRNDQIPAAKNPEHQSLLDQIKEREQAAHNVASTNKNDFRSLLNYSLADTEDFLRATSPDPYYDRGAVAKQYYPEGGWL